MKEVGAIKIFEDIISGKVFKRPGLDKLIGYARPNDLLCAAGLDRLGTFESSRHARRIISGWQEDYNYVYPHSSLSYTHLSGLLQTTQTHKILSTLAP